YPFMYELTSYYYYSLFNLYPYEESDYHWYCNLFSKGSDSDKCDLYSLCMSVRYIFSQVKELLSHEYFDSDSKWCEQLSYWIHSYINSDKSCGNVNELYIQLNRLKKGYFPLYNNCNIESFENVEEDLKKKKELFLHSENFYWIQKTNNLNINSYNTSFVNYFKECFKLYNNVLKQDFCKRKTVYETDLINFQRNYNAASKYLREKGIDISTDEL
ncbi:hypothetical protein PVMG_06203, partial [Plasmodium vivax Mauritania I]